MVTHTSKTGDNDFSRVVGRLPPGTPIEAIGWSELVSHKQEAFRLARLCAGEMASEGPSVLSTTDFDDLDLLLRQLVVICEGDVLTGQILAAVCGPGNVKSGRDPQTLVTFAIRAENVAAQARTTFGPDFFGEFPLRMQSWADWARNESSKSGE